MADSPGTVAVRRRNQLKCSFCRERRVSCVRDRSGHADHWLPCQDCAKRNLSCSPDFRSSDDPLAPRRRSLHPNRTSQTSSGPSALTRAQIHQAAPLATTFTPRTVVETGHQLPNLEIKQKAFESIAYLETLQETQALAAESKLLPPTCLNSKDYRWTTFLNAIPSITHRLFREICDLAMECDRRQSPDLAGYILTKLFSAADKYPAIYDGRKQGMIERLLPFFERQGDNGSVHYLLTRLANLADITMPSLNANLSGGLAKSLETISNLNRQTLAGIWRETYGEDAPSNLFVSPYLLASQQCSEKVLCSLSDCLVAIDDHPGLFNAGPLHIAAAMGNVSALSRHLVTSENVDVKDQNHRTPLFLAVAHGHSDCCAILLQYKADPNIRDTHGHTAMEVAARGGHLDCVQRLKDKGGVVDPPSGFGVQGIICTSTPLQAAFESVSINGPLIYYLLNEGADPWTTRGSDGKHAIDLAKERGEAFWVTLMSERPNLSADFINPAHGLSLT